MSTPTRLVTRPATPNEHNWRSYAACTGQDPEMWFPIGDNNAARAQADEAKAVCRRCPAQEWCLQWALETRQDTGVWGGLTEQERFRVHRRRGPGYWARRRNVADHMYETRREELLGLLADALEVKAIAVAMNTNVQTVNRLMDRLAAEEAVEEAMSA